MPKPAARSRPLSLIVAAILSGLAAAALAIMGVASAASHPSLLSAGIGAVLLVWAAAVGSASTALYRGRRWSRGLVVAAGLLHAATFANFVPSQPLAVVPATIALVTVVAAVWPSTTAALHLDARP